MLAPLTIGAGAGLGLALIMYGLFPPRPALAQLMDRLRRPPDLARSRRERMHSALSAPARRLGLPRAAVRTDLALLQVDPGEHLAEQTTLALLGALGMPLSAAVLGFSGQTPLWLSVLGAVVGWWWADAAAHARAERLRAQIQHTLSVMLTLLSVSLARGAGIEQAFDEAAGMCSGPAADRIRGAVAGARILRRPPWQLLGDLGEETAVPDLSDLALSMNLAGSDGARIRASLHARADAVRRAAITRDQVAAEKASSRMALPLMVLAMCYLAFLLYPAIGALNVTG
jgi:tight adherence protein C